MNAYVVTEGPTEAAVYPYWIPSVNPALKQVFSVDDLVSDNYYLISSSGFPFFNETVEAAAQDLQLRPHIDRLILAADSEDLSRDEKLLELEELIGRLIIRAEVRIIAQHFSFEAWALGNQHAVPARPRSSVLRSYKAIHNVRGEDPELLPPHPLGELNRAQFASHYIRLALNDHHSHLTYTKGRPRPLMNSVYYQRLVNRNARTGHIPSFTSFAGAFGP